MKGRNNMDKFSNDLEIMRGETIEESAEWNIKNYKWANVTTHRDKESEK